MMHPEPEKSPVRHQQQQISEYHPEPWWKMETPRRALRVVWVVGVLAIIAVSAGFARSVAPPTHTALETSLQGIGYLGLAAAAGAGFSFLGVLISTRLSR